MKRLFLTACLLLPLAACSSDVSTGAGFSVEEIKMGIELNEKGEITKDTSNFSTDPSAITVHVVTQDVAGPHELIGSWWFDEGTGQKIFESRVVVVPSASVARFFLENSKPWPAGKYHFVVSSEGKTLKQRSFEITAAEAN